MTVGDFLHNLTKSEEFKNDRKFFIPIGVRLETPVTQYNDFTADGSFDIHEVSLDDYEPQQCEKIYCKYNVQEIDVVSGKIQVNKNKIGEERINIYPNPAEDLLNIEVPYKLYPKSKIQILNALGQVVFTKNCSEESAIKVDVSSFATGTYTVNVFDCDNNQVYNNKFIKQ